MKNCTETQMAQICSTCGNIGFAEQLVTCYECKKSTDHIYCIWDRLLKVPTVWYCEECLGAPADHLEIEKTSKRQKIVTGTEKSNGLLERSPPLKSSEVTRHVNDHEQQSWAKKSVSTILNTKVKSTACANSEALFRQGDSMSSPVSNISNSPSSIQFLYKKKMGPADADVHSPPSKYIKRMSEVGNRKAETPEKAKASGSAFHSNSEFIRTGFPETNMPTLVNQYEEVLHCHSPQVSWKGTFEIFDVASHLYKKMRAHLPTAICPKVYESLKKMPETLKFKLSPREDIWPKIFRLEPPTKNDMGLYFFPSELGRPKDKYLRLLERLNSRNLAMVTCMNDVQLLLFTSDELPFGSQRKDAEIYLWGLFRHVKHRKPSCKIKVEYPSYDSPMDSRDNDCAELNLPSQCSFEEVAMEVDMVGGKDVGRMDIPIRRPTLPHCLLETNAKCLNYVERSLVQLSCEKLASPNILDVPPGFSKLKPPIFSEELGSKYHSGSLESTFKGCTHSREDIPEENTYTSDRSPETNAKDLNCEERSSVQCSSAKKVKAGPILPDVPPCLSKVVPQDDLMLLSSKHINLSLESTSKSCIPSSIKLPIQRTCTSNGSAETNVDSRDNDCAELNLPSQCSFEEVAMEVDMVGGKDVGRIDIPIRRPTLPHCLLETNAKCLNYVERSLVQLSCEKLASPNILDVPPGFSKLKPPIFSEELGSKYHSGSLESTFKGCTHSREDIPEENTYTSDRSPETNAKDLNCEERSSVQCSSAKKVKAGPILPDVPPCLSKVVPQADLIPLSSKHINLSLESTSKSCIPSSIKLPIQRTCTSNGSAETNATDLICVQRPLVKFFMEKLISPIRPEVPKCFLKDKPSGSSELLSSIHRGNSLESTSNASRPSKLHSGYNLSSSMEGVASAPNTPDMQSKHHKEQSPGYQNRSPMHIKSSHSSSSAKTKKEVTVFSSPVRDAKLHAGSKNLPSPYAEKVNNFSENLSQERFFISNKDSEKRGHNNFLERSSRSGNIPQQDVKVHSMKKNIGPKESTEQEFKRADQDNMVNEEDEGRKETVPQSRISWVQQSKPDPEECMEYKKREREGTLYLTNKKVRCSPLENSQSPFPEARRWAGLVRESKNAVADELVSKKDIEQIGKEKQSKLDSENKTLCTVSVLHSSPSNILELPKHGMQGPKKIVSYKLVTDGDMEVEEKMKSQRELDSEAKHLSLVGYLYNSPSTNPELPKDGIQRKKIMVSYKPVSDGDREVMEKKSTRELDSENKTVCSVSALHSSPSNILELTKHVPQEQKRTVSYKLVMDGDKEVAEKMNSKRELDSEAKHSSLVADPYNSSSTISELSKDGFQRQKRMVSYKLVMDRDRELVDKMKSQRELDSENKQSSLVADLYKSPSSNTQIPLLADFYSPSSSNCLARIPLVADFYSPTSGNCLSVNESSNPEQTISSAKQDEKEGKRERGRMVFEEWGDKEDIRGHNKMDTEKRQMGSILDDHSNPTCSGQPSPSSATPYYPSLLTNCKRSQC